MACPRGCCILPRHARSEVVRLQAALETPASRFPESEKNGNKVLFDALGC